MNADARSENANVLEFRRRVTAFKRNKYFRSYRMIFLERRKSEQSTFDCIVFGENKKRMDKSKYVLTGGVWYFSRLIRYRQTTTVLFGPKMCSE